MSKKKSQDQNQTQKPIPQPEGVAQEFISRYPAWGLHSTQTELGASGDVLQCGNEPIFLAWSPFSGEWCSFIGLDDLDHGDEIIPVGDNVFAGATPDEAVKKLIDYLGWQLRLLQLAL